MSVNNESVLLFSNLESNETTFLNVTVPIIHAQLLLYDILIPCLGVFIIVLNLAVVISSGLILKQGYQPRSTYMLLGNVALCDLVTGISVVMGQTFPSNARNHNLCAFQLGLIVSSTLTSIYSVGLIAIDRYLYIIHGLQYQRWMYPMRVRILITSTWFIGCIVGFLPVMGWSNDTQNGKICWFIKLVPPNLILLTCLIGIIPILIVIVLYLIILYHAIKKVIQLRRAETGTQRTNSNENQIRINVTTHRNKNIINDADNKNENIFQKIFIKKSNRRNVVDVKSPSKIKAIKVVVFVTGSFIITWIPYFSASFLFVNCDPDVTPEKCNSLQVLIASPLAILGFTNSLLNPIIYAWWHKGFRAFVKKLINRKIFMYKQNNQKSSSSTATKSTKISINSISSKKSSIYTITGQLTDNEHLQSKNYVTRL